MSQDLRELPEIKFTEGEKKQLVRRIANYIQILQACIAKGDIEVFTPAILHTNQSILAKLSDTPILLNGDELKELISVAKATIGIIEGYIARGTEDVYHRGTLALYKSILAKLLA